MIDSIQGWYDFQGKVAVITGGTGVLLRTASVTLGRLGAQVALVGRDEAKGQAVLDELAQAGAKGIFVRADVGDTSAIGQAAAQVQDRFGRVDLLINGAGGNRPQATTSAEQSFFDLPPEVISHVMDLNFTGLFACCQAFGRAMADRGEGNIVNIASVAGVRPLTRVAGYAAAKAAVISLTQWLAVHMAQTYSPRIRVNALAPGFFRTEQNRYLLTDANTGELTPRGQAILSHTPMNRFGEPGDLLGPLLYLLSPASAFVTGTVLAVDGGFTAFAGV